MDEFTRCSACPRHPLVGEWVTLMCDGGVESPVCDLCLDRPRSIALGEPKRRERIRTVAGAANIRLLAPVPAARRAPVAAAA
jgi:hypothetical protein